MSAVQFWARILSTLCLRIRTHLTCDYYLLLMQRGKLANLPFILLRALLEGLSKSVIWSLLPTLCLTISNTDALHVFLHLFTSSQLLQPLLLVWLLSVLPVGTTNEGLSLDASSVPPIKSTWVSSTRSPGIQKSQLRVMESVYEHKTFSI